MKNVISGLIGSILLINMASAGDFQISSPQIKTGSTIQHEQVFNGFGCKGDNISPELRWTGAPEQTRSYAVTVYDKDAPTGSGWWHWVVFNIPKSAGGLDKGAGSGVSVMPQGSVQSRTDFGKPGYGGPCPPQGDKSHRYQVTVYALKTDKLPLDENAPAAMVGFYLHQNLIEKAVLTAHYSR